MKNMLVFIVSVIIFMTCSTDSNLKEYILGSWQTSYIKIVMPSDSVRATSRIYEDDFADAKSPKAQSIYHEDGSFEGWYLMPNGEKNGTTKGRWTTTGDTLKVMYSFDNRRIEAQYRVEKTAEGFRAISIYDWSNNGVHNDTLYMESRRLSE